ncbi:hypothetical protein [Psychrobacter sp. I-STPA6b]|uniref:hypothetical protein n=1 Tax=Psychrobacter sp. I-STPA6b TaxID=2585718 RepID=UPI001D0C5789|nr:hypothetical protein [Psychrobacter sp. I-STPA6b]
MSDKNNIHEIVIADSENEKVFSLKKIDRHVKGRQLSLNEQNFIESHLSSIIGSIPNIGKTIDSMNSYTAHFSKDTMENLKNGVVVIHKTKEGKILPQVVDKESKKILEQARLKSGVSPANMALLGLQIATMITAQQHLATINSKLNDINKGLEEISKYLEEQYFLEIQEDIDHVRSLINSFSKNQYNFFDEFEKIHIHHIVPVFKRINKNIRILVNKILSSIEKMELKKFDERKIDKTIISFNEDFDKIYNLIEILYSMIQAQQMIEYIYNIFYTNSSFNDSWHEKIEKNIFTYRSIIEKFNKVVDKKNDELDESWAWYEILGTGAMVTAALPVVAIWQGLSLTGLVKPIDFNEETELEKAKKLNKEPLKNKMKEINRGLYDLEKFSEKFKDNMNIKVDIVFDITPDGEASNIRLLEKINY